MGWRDGGVWEWGGGGLREWEWDGVEGGKEGLGVWVGGGGRYGGAGVGRSFKVVKKTKDLVTSNQFSI